MQGGCWQLGTVAACPRAKTAITGSPATKSGINLRKSLKNSKKTFSVLESLDSRCDTPKSITDFLLIYRRRFFRPVFDFRIPFFKFLQTKPPKEWFERCSGGAWSCGSKVQTTREKEVLR
jgi:hypothetical protein